MIHAQSPRGIRYQADAQQSHVMQETIKGYVGQQQLMTSTIFGSAENIGSYLKVRFFPSRALCSQAESRRHYWTTKRAREKPIGPGQNFESFV
jgi:hypothetical protein